MASEADTSGRGANESVMTGYGGGPRPEPGARWAGLMLFALAAAAAAVAPLLFDGSLSMRSLRETAPLAALIGAGIGAAVMTRWPRSIGGALATAVLSAFVAFVFFSMLYLFGEAVISAYRSEPAGAAIAAASGRLWDRLPIGAASAVVAFGVAALVLRAIGAGVLALAERKARRARRR